MKLRDVPWQWQVFGQKSAEITLKLLCPGHEAARQTYVLVPNPSPYSLALATWGLSACMTRPEHPGHPITLLLGNKPVPAIDGSLPAWIDVRLGWLGRLLEMGLLTVVVADFDAQRIPKSLSARFFEGLATILVRDGELSDKSGDIVAWALFDGPGGVDAEFVWNYGDPAKRGKALLDGFVASAATPSANTVAEDWKALLRAHDKGEATDWTELFPGAAAVAEDRPLYPHQKEAIAAWLKNGGRGIYMFCTGGGKTVAALRTVKAIADAPGFQVGPVIVTVPTRILGDQWQREIRREGFEAPLEAYNNKIDWIEYLEPYLKASKQPRFIVSTYATFNSAAFQNILREQGEGSHALWIADEMHNISSKSRLNILGPCGKVFPYRLGLSATPAIEGDDNATAQLLDFFGKVVAAYELEAGIRDGVLCPYNYYPQPVFLSPEIGLQYLRNLQQIEANPNLVDLYRQKRELIRTAGVQVTAFNDILKALPPDFSHTLVYCPPGFGGKVKEADEDLFDENETPESDERRLIEAIVTRLQERDISVATILGFTPQADRTSTLRRFKAGDVRAVCAIGCLDEGVDVPAIKRAIVLYSHDSEKQFIQRRGRILRKDETDPGKIAEIRDVLILPHGVDMPAAVQQQLLAREMRRYRHFAGLAQNRDEAAEILKKALEHVSQ